MFEFLDRIDLNTEPKNIKLQYYYYIGSNNLNNEIQQESIDEYKRNLDTRKVAKMEHHHIYKDESQERRQRVKWRYGKDAAEIINKGH